MELSSIRLPLEWISGVVSPFAFYYPLFMSWLWMVGAVYFYFRLESGHRGDIARPPPLEHVPRVAILLPCFNEGDHLEEIIVSLADLDYPDYEIVAVNDGSVDNTAVVLDRMALVQPRLRVVHLLSNQGKATALNVASSVTDAELLVGLDGDAVLDRYALRWMVSHFQTGRVGAVTGNPRVRTRSTLIGRLQVGEFSSIIGLIKRAQRTYGRIFTISGVVACFRKRALADVGMWSTDMLTEDVDISWKLQTRHWDVRFEPRALCWILMPETLKGLWRQRLRWAVGGTQVLLKNRWTLTRWRQRRLWPIFLEFLTSVLWAYAICIVALLHVLLLLLGDPAMQRLEAWLPGWTGLLVGATSLIQVAVSMRLDRRYDLGLGRNFYWMIWYPLAYWMINALTTVVAVPRALLREKGRNARWVSPDRGLRPKR